MKTNKIYESQTAKIYEIDDSSEYKIEAGQLFWFTDSDGNGSIPEILMNTKIETEVVSFLKKYETEQ